MKGLITAVHRDRYEVEVENGQIYAKLKTGVYYSDKYAEAFPTVGDYVELEYNTMGDSLITETMERKTCFTRKDPDDGQGEQTIAANFDYVFIMMSLNRDFNLKRLERYLTVAWQSGAQPVVVLTKADLAEDVPEKVLLAQSSTIGADVCAVSAVTGQGMDALSKYLQAGRVIVFLGSSGVGKSTFTNFLAGDAVMQTNGIREDDSRGHHTTTYRQMVTLPSGVRIIDTPGMRELGMWTVDDGIEQSFSDIGELIMRCRFSDCSHGNEPGCAVRAALENGTLQESRWLNYLKLQKESGFQKMKAHQNEIRVKKLEARKNAKNLEKEQRKIRYE